MKQTSKEEELLTRSRRYRRRCRRSDAVEGVRDGDYRLPPTAGAISRCGQGRPDYGVTCCYIPEPGRKFEIPEVHFERMVSSRGRSQRPRRSARLPASTGERTPAAGNRSAEAARLCIERQAPRTRRVDRFARQSADRPGHRQPHLVLAFRYRHRRTPGNFGKMGAPPSHPELLELAGH